MTFTDVFGRVNKETEIKKIIQLADFIGVSQSYVSKKKKENDFPVDWAFRIARRYGLVTDWIMTGEGPKRFDEAVYYKFPILKLLDTWLAEVVINEPSRRDWFTHSVRDAFPMFDKWLKRREAKACRDSDSAGKQVA